MTTPSEKEMQLLADRMSACIDDINETKLRIAMTRQDCLILPEIPTDLPKAWNYTYSYQIYKRKNPSELVFYYNEQAGQERGRDLIDMYEHTGFLEMAYDNGFSIFSWIRVYMEDKFLDNDGAALMINCNQDDPFYRGLAIYESFDEPRYTLLDSKCNIAVAINEYKQFNPLSFGLTEERFYVSYMANKYEIK